MKIVLHKNINKKIIGENIDTLYIIEDNNKNTIYNSLSYNGLVDNVVYIRTKKNSSKRTNSFFEDIYFDENKQIISSDFIYIKSKMLRYNKISLSQLGYGNYMSKHSPKTYKFLFDLLYHNFGFNNKTKTYEKRIPSYEEIKKSKNIDISHYNPIKTELIKNFKSISITIDDKVEIGDILKLKHNETKEEIICKVNIPSYDKDNIKDDYYNLFEGYTNPKNNAKLQFHFDYIATTKNGIINFADNNINKLDKKIKNKSVEGKNKEKIDKSEDINTNDVNWFGTEDIKKKLKKFLNSKSNDKSPSVLDLNNNNFLVITDVNLFEVNHYNNNFKIVNKFEPVHYKLVDIFDSIYLFIKEVIYDEERINFLKIDNLNIDIIDNFLKSKNLNG